MKGVFVFGSCVWIFCFLNAVKASPVSEGFNSSLTNVTKLLRDSSDRACIYNDKVYEAGDTFMREDPCGMCTCTPPGYTCSDKMCEVKPGCKAIQNANSCCLEYVCECERNGKTYGNGEKVEESDPCKVCYCKGGDIKCTSITCYSRTDCEPVFVEGRCCPKYDHCPPLEKKDNSTSSEPTSIEISDIGSLNERSLLSKDKATESSGEGKPTKESYPGVDVVEFVSVTTEGTSATGIHRDEGEETPSPDPDTSTEPLDITNEVVIYNERSLKPKQSAEEAGESENSELRAENSAETSKIISTIPPTTLSPELSRNEITTISVIKRTENENSTEKNEKALRHEDTETESDNINASENGSAISRSSGEESFERNPKAIQRAAREDLGIPGLKMLSADHMEFLKLGEEPPVYVDPPKSIVARSPQKESEGDGGVTT